jgi:hypothetical protein
LQQFGEEGTPSENSRNVLMDVKEEHAILAATRALNNEDEPTPKKRGRPSKGGKASALPMRKKSSTKKTKKEGNKGGSGFGWRVKLRRKGSVPTQWQDYEVEILIAIWGGMEEEFSRCTKIQGIFLLLIEFFSIVC